MKWGVLRDKWKMKMLVAEMAAGPCFAPAEVRAPLVQPQGQRSEDWLKNLQAKKRDFFLYCLTEPLVSASRAACCGPKDQKRLFLFCTAAEVSRVSRTYGFGMSLSHWARPGATAVLVLCVLVQVDQTSSMRLPWQRADRTGAGGTDSLVTAEGALGFFKRQEHLYWMAVGLGLSAPESCRPSPCWEREHPRAPRAPRRRRGTGPVRLRAGTGRWACSPPLLWGRFMC